MRKCLLSLLSCAALLIACQPITPIPIKIKSPSPNMKMNDDAPIHLYHRTTCVTKRHPCLPKHCHRIPLIKIIIKPKLTLPLALSLKAVKPKQIRHGIADITPKMWLGPKPLIQQNIGFATPILVHNLGKQIWFARRLNRSLAISVWKLCC